MKRIVIDAGHGGEDPGAVNGKLKEKEIALKISLYCKGYLQKNYKVNIKMTRNNDVFVSLKERSKIANRFKADLFISVHVNAGGGTGFESFIYENSERCTLDHQKCIHKEIVSTMDAHTEIKDRGMKTANYAVLRETKMPAILTENLFIDVDDILLKDEELLKSIGEAHARGIAKSLGLEEKV
ncbi:N-acetylmuramoyl-L-alanine amidase family protein [Priestia aryabhattai]|uniref:N-acetylmuramoyl-L-alanine amidase family protein n=1 Tax=Priestia aryabhattai TaxID=412384 RepID=UPI001C8D24E7|nr:N-acetylmuramoyl-L-alanine amidase [Priestia aryabhattai]MBY0065225.1 N-acetylmuramoyl-L-alanine amidase [Priestia aryabhattai]